MNEGKAGSNECRAAGTIGEMLRCFRERRLWTQATLAERAGLPEKTISSLETGARRKPHLTTLEMLADALELDAADRDALRASRDGRSLVSGPAPATVPLLPLPATTFVGREEPVRQVTELLGRPEVRLLTLTGTGGMGKTRLALHVGDAIAGRFPDGVFFVDCASVRDHVLLPGAVAHAIDLHVPGGQPVESALTDFFAVRRALVILDNMEQVLAAATFVDRLVAGCPELVVLVTSRERLALTREHVYLVSAMTVPDQEAVSTPEAIAPSEAVQLFVQRARATLASFDLTAANAADVAAICNGLDGIPLAIELAAARLAHVGAPAVLRERLDRRLAWLASNLRDREPRHRTMRAAIEWSYDALDPDDQRLFRCLAVFAGGFTFDAAGAVSLQTADGRRQNESTADWRLPSADSVFDGIASLVDKNLIQLYDDPDGGTRYRMLETIREFALERLAESGEESAVRSSHAATYLELAERGEEELSGPNQRGWLVRLGAESDNIRSALAWMIEQRDAERACRLSSALWRFWAASGRVEEGRLLMDKALALEFPNATPVRAKALRRFGNLAVEQADYAAARDAYTASMDLAEVTRDENARHVALGSIGFVAYYLGDYGRARTSLEEALSALDEPEDRAPFLFVLGEVACAVGRFDEAEDLYRSSRELRRSFGDEFGAANASVGLARIARVTGRAAEARRLLEESLTVFQTGNERPREALAMLELAQLARTEGDADAALELARRSLALHHTLGDLHGVVDSLDVITLVLLDQGDHEVARRLTDAAESWRGAHGVPRPLPLQVDYDPALARFRAEFEGNNLIPTPSTGVAMPAERAAAWYLALSI